MDSSSSITVNQTLHGYRGGHRQLQSSIKLSIESERIMLLLSDLSGSVITRRFETYLTGYPLTHDNLYAIAKTWYADEMTRAGSVWTHTILVDFEQVKNISNLKELCEFFERPNNDSNFSSYKMPLIFNSKNNCEATDVSNDSDEKHIKEDKANSLLFAAEILTAIYDLETPVILFADDSKQFEELTINIWNQRWSDLRCAYKFCTGSIASRKLQGDIFDLQVAPNRSINKIKREERSATFFELNELDENNSPTWAIRAAEDLFSLKDTNFRHFLWQFGPKISDSDQRSTFAKLAKIYQFIESQSAQNSNFLPRIIKIVFEQFPSNDQASELKSSLFGEGQIRKIFPYLKISESKIIEALVKTTQYSAFNKNSLDIKNRTTKLLKNKQLDALQIALDLLDRTQTPLGKEFIGSFIKNAGVYETVEISRKHPHMLFEFLKLKPELALNKEIWHLSPNKWELFSFVLHHFSASPDIVRELIYRTLDANAFEILNELKSSLGNELVSIILDWFNRSDIAIDNIPIQVKDLLKFKDKEVLDWISNNETTAKTVAFVTTFLEPDSYRVTHAPIEPWLRLAESKNDISDINLMQSMTFLLTLSFNNPQKQGDKLAEISFQVVHDFLEVDQVPYEQWQQLKYYAPSLKWDEDWDKCKRLRVALIKYFIRNNWSEQSFLNAINKEDTWHKICEDFNEVRNSNQFLDSLAKGVSKKKLKVSKFQKKTFTSRKKKSLK